MGHFVYRRHFAVLFGVVGVLVATSRWRPSLGINATFAVYGALHALALVASLRKRGSLVRRTLFVAGAGAISGASAFLGLEAVHYVGSVPVLVRSMSVLGLASGFGAVCYALLIRRCWTPHLSHHAVLAIVCACILATEFVVVFGLLPKTADGLWFAALWWFAFSLTLSHQDCRAPTRR